MSNKGYNSSKITISLKKEEREALIQAAEARGVAVSTLCAEIIRKHIKRRYEITDRETRPATNNGGGRKKKAEKA